MARGARTVTSAPLPSRCAFASAPLPSRCASRTLPAVADRVLVIGGTGPTGLPLVRGLVDRGHAVTILHRGLHERPETPTEVEHLHADPYDPDALHDIARDRNFDVVVAMYGRLRRIAAEWQGPTPRAGSGR